jgi:hypothetical protein
VLCLSIVLLVNSGQKLALIAGERMSNSNLKRKSEDEQNDNLIFFYLIIMHLCIKIKSKIKAIKDIQKE